uniref:hypothetical protein n=1 Tax=Brucella pseudintermedia TaxID=370111 RepID=UPI00158B8D36|nr:hypothetical protein [Brucella pseudintermedia]
MPDVIAIFHEAVKKGWPDFTRRNASDFLRSYFGKEYRSISPERAKLVAQEYLDEYGVAADYPQEASHAE